MEYFNEETNHKPVKGSVLLSEPLLPDPNFERTVILLCENNEEGAFGFVLNKLSQFQIGDVIQEAENCTVPLFIGGPVEQDTLHFLHSDPENIPGGVEILQGLYWGGEFERVLSMINLGKFDHNAFRFFLGYSGWGYEQLIDELKGNSWIVCNNVSVSEILNADPSDFWKKILKDMGGRYRMFTNYPTDPRMN